MIPGDFEHEQVWHPRTQEDHAVVRAELVRVITSPHFNKSNRYPQFLTFIVERFLNGEIENLKERTIAIQVLGRPEDFESNTDPVVRVIANEIRKRLAMVYQESDDSVGCRIGLPPGGYIPLFKKAEPPLAMTAAEEETPKMVDFVKEAHVVHPTDPRRMAWLWAGCGLGLLAALVFCWTLWRSTQTTDLDRLWEPAVQSSSPVLMVLGGDNMPAGVRNSKSLLPGTTYKQFSREIDRVSYMEMVTMSIVNWHLAKRGKRTQIYRSDITRIESLAHGPSVLIGSFDNVWTLRAMNQLRFYLNKVDSNLQIRDRTDEKQVWQQDESIQIADLKVDYALVGRIKSADTKQYTYFIAGLGPLATLGAARVLTTPSAFDELQKQFHRRVGDDNFEAVLSTPIVDGLPGEPDILAGYCWK